MSTDLLVTAAALSAAPSVGIGLIAALIDPGARAGLVALAAFAVITTAMTQVLA